MSQLVHVANPLEKVSIQGLDLSLLAAGDGTEVIHHRLAAGHRWSLHPEQGWQALEFVLILSGRLRAHLPNGERMLEAGDCVANCPVRADHLFFAETDSEFIYVSSQPVFHHYSRSVRDMMDLAVAVEEKDGYTADHCQRIKNLAMLVGENMHLDHSEMLSLNLGSFLHDLGKVRVPQAILGKPGPLTNDEWDVMKQHPTYGRSMVEQAKLPYMQVAASIVEQHHERWDGSGYPRGLTATEILPMSAIVAVVDSYDAMTTDRPYRKGRPKGDALEEIRRGRGSLYRPDVADAFCGIMERPTDQSCQLFQTKEVTA